MDETIDKVLNPLIARQNIIEFNDKLNGQFTKLKEELISFNNELRESWYSEKAIEFSVIYLGLVEDLCNNILNFIKCVDKDACSNYNFEAEKTGKTTIEVSFLSDVNINLLPFMRQSADGTIGMDIVKVKNYLEEFAKNMNSILQGFGNLPSYIVLYKNSNGGKVYYFTKPDIIYNQIKELIQKVISSVTSYVNQEIDNVSKAQQLAVDELK